MLLTPYVAPTKRTIPTYRAAVFNVATERMKPAMATAFETVMCQVRSLRRPEDHDTKILRAPATI